MATLADITTHLTSAEAAAQADLTAVGQLITLVETLSADLKAALAANDPTAVQAIVDRLDADTAQAQQTLAQIQAAVAANTPPAAPSAVTNAGTAGG